MSSTTAIQAQAQKTLFLTKLSPQLYRTCITKVSTTSDVSESFVEFVAKSHMAQIRKASDPAVTTAMVMSEVRAISSEYGAKKEIEISTAKECVKFIFERFGHLAVDEIRKAYRMWASEEILTKGAEFYSGSFNVAQIGKVLSAYNEVRKRVLGNYLSIVQAEQEELERQQKAETAKGRFEVEFPEIVMKAKETVGEWREVPAYFYESIQKRWPMRFEPGEAQEIFEEAKELASLEIKKEREESYSGGLRARFEAMDRERSFEEIAKTIARKIAVFRKVIKNPDFLIDE